MGQTCSRAPVTPLSDIDLLRSPAPVTVPFSLAGVLPEITYKNGSIPEQWIRYSYSGTFARAIILRICGGSALPWNISAWAGCPSPERHVLPPQRASADSSTGCHEVWIALDHRRPTDMWLQLLGQQPYDGSPMEDVRVEAHVRAGGLFCAAAGVLVLLVGAMLLALLVLLALPPRSPGSRSSQGHDRRHSRARALATTVARRAALSLFVAFYLCLLWGTKDLIHIRSILAHVLLQTLLNRGSLSEVRGVLSDLLTLPTGGSEWERVCRYLARLNAYVFRYSYIVVESHLGVFTLGAKVGVWLYEMPLNGVRQAGCLLTVYAISQGYSVSH